ncbi:OLC1v1001907C3 [Oldenlandia corymbosa var. corymbosa]|uniref:OLC1v1001907C3 n=1 Tax=Oldenlandia corymbosa var. corymbosa TaxID=529605 RepID=A0AAV1D6J1_OLDCO|nr:OLC1v1001907C3 [Oldenlandia corymbosa var. corymbosa]
MMGCPALFTSGGSQNLSLPTSFGRIFTCRIQKRHPAETHSLLSRDPQYHLCLNKNNFRIHAAAGASDPNSSSSSQLQETVIRNLAVSSVVLLVGLCFNYQSLSTPVAPFVTSQNQGVVEDVEAGDDMSEAFEKWKSKINNLVVPLRIVVPHNSVPHVWFKDLIKSQGKGMRFRCESRRCLNDIFFELQAPVEKGTARPQSALAAADVVSLSEYLISPAIKEGLIEPIEGVEQQDWFHDLPEEWKAYVRRSNDGKLDPQGQVWAVPYRWGSLVIAYNKRKFERHKMDPIEDWADLWRPELTGKISMLDCPRQVIGAVLKYMGASYNTQDITSEVAGGKEGLLKNLLFFFRQVLLFDSVYYLKAFEIGDTWVVVGWSYDILPFAKRMSDVAVIVPKSGASLWADFWVCTEILFDHSD